MQRLFIFTFAALVCLSSSKMAQALNPTRVPQADEHYKVDILLVVAHPDDEGVATPYVARPIDEGKRVAVSYGTSGSSGESQAAALGDIREIEARRADAVPGIDKVSALGGIVKDTMSDALIIANPTPPRICQACPGPG